ncbi:MAG: lipoate protein ligase C-terminal domain-containing protein [Candidatus Hydrothermarchaeaceae archaeon]
MRHVVHKTKGGLIRVAVDADDRIKDIRITGDFFIYPEESVEALEKALVGVSAKEGEILKVVKDFYENIEGMDIGPEDIVNAIKRAL